MGDSFQQDLERKAKDIRIQARDFRTDNLMSFFSTYDAVIRYVDLEIAKFNVSHSGFKILDTLILNEGRMRPTEISKELFRSKDSITRVLDTLEKKGLIKRETNEKDHRTKKVSITKEGLKIAKIGYEAGRVSKEIFSFLDKEQSDILSDILKKTREHTLTLIGKKYAKG
jgi:MarR family transcriptional regulator, organic hydroperoxide resistance regulator